MQGEDNGFAFLRGIPYEKGLKMKSTSVLRPGRRRKLPATVLGVSAAIVAVSTPLSAGENPETTKLDEIVVTATKTPHTLVDVPVETVVVTAKEIEKTNAQNALDVLREISGISAANHDDVFGSYTWRATLHGLPFDSGYALVLIDGQRVMGSGQSGGMGEYGIGLNQIPLSMIERIEVVKGPGSALYGSDAVAGVINIITRKVPAEPTAWASVAYGVYEVKRQLEDGTEEEAPGDRSQSQAALGYGDRITDNLGYLVSYSYESGDDIRAEPLQSDRHALLTKVDGRFTDFGLTGKIELSDYEKTDNRDEESYRISLGGEYQLGENQVLSLRGYTYLWDFSHGVVGGTHGFKNGDVGYNQAEMQYSWFMSETNTLSLGVEYREQDIDYTILNSDGSLVSVDEDVRTSSLYLQDEYVPFEWLTLVAGARYDDHSDFGEEINPKFSAMLQPLASTTIRFSIGRSFKSPTIRQLYYDFPYRHGDWYAQSNRDLKPEKAIGYTAGIEQRMMNNRVILNLGYFRNDVEDLVIREDTGELFLGLPLARYENVEEAWTQGIEFMASARPLPGLDLALSYTYTDSENEETGKQLTYVPDHSLTFRPTYEYMPWGLGASVGITYVGSQFTNSDNTGEIDDYTLVGAKILKDLSDICTLSLEVDDIFDSRQNSENRYYVGRTLMLKLSTEY